MTTNKPQATTTRTARHAGRAEPWIAARAAINRGWVAAPKHSRKALRDTMPREGRAQAMRKRIYIALRSTFTAYPYARHVAAPHRLAD